MVFLVPPERYMDMVLKLARAAVFYILPISSFKIIFSFGTV